MTTFLRLLAEKEKATALLDICAAVRAGQDESRVFDVQPDSFRAVPGAPFAYWVGDQLRDLFSSLPAFERHDRTAKAGLATNDDARFLRLFWEVSTLGASARSEWVPLAKGGSPSSFYSDLPFVVLWTSDGAELKAFASAYRSSHGWGDQWTAMINATEFYFRPGFTWPLRASHFAPSVLPAGCAFSKRGCGGFSPNEDLLWLIGLLNSSCADFIFKLLLGRFGHPEFAGGALQRMPIPNVEIDKSNRLKHFTLKAWSLKRALDTVEETSHAFLLPAVLRDRLGEFDSDAIEAEIADIQAEIDDLAFEIYRFSSADRAAVTQAVTTEDRDADQEDAEDEEEHEVPADKRSALLSWSVGVAVGRFDWRLATGERATPPEPEPFDPLAAKSPGMLPDGAASFHAHAGILVDDPGHPHDLARLVEEVLTRVETSAPEDVRRWLQRDFFPFHLQRYSKSRRKAPIYWPLSTTSGSYTLWVYYPSLTSQTLYTAINDFVEPKLQQVGADVAVLRNKGSARTRDDEKQFETLQAFELELIELRDTLLKLAANYKPSHDDGVQISAAPLWPLFRHKPWQKVLKETWAKLEKSDYDWPHLAMNYWPERVREKCRTDKSLAIAHGLEQLYVEPEAQPKKPRGRKKAGGDE
jgi:hypothetical protein